MQARKFLLLLQHQQFWLAHDFVDWEFAKVLPVHHHWGGLSSRYNQMSASTVDILNILKLKGAGYPRLTAGDSAGTADWIIYTGPFQHGDLRQLNFVNYSSFPPRNKAKLPGLL